MARWHAERSAKIRMEHSLIREALRPPSSAHQTRAPAGTPLPNETSMARRSMASRHQAVPNRIDHTCTFKMDDIRATTVNKTTAQDGSSVFLAISLPGVWHEAKAVLILSFQSLRKNVIYGTFPTETSHTYSRGGFLSNRSHQWRIPPLR